MNCTTIVNYVIRILDLLVIKREKSIFSNCFLKIVNYYLIFVFCNVNMNIFDTKFIPILTCLILKFFF